MSTKNLARSVIEGGRAARNKFYRWRSNGTQRTRERLVEHRLVSGGDYDDVVFPERDFVWRRFDDKLSPAERWLERQVGKPWKRTHGDILQRFDTRTTAGRHIVFCHLLQMVDLGAAPAPWRHYRLFVDARGILRRRANRRVRFIGRGRLPESAAALSAFLSGRRVGQVDSHFYWYEPTPAGGFRQHRELCEVERERWLRLPEWFREEHGPHYRDQDRAL